MLCGADDCIIVRLGHAQSLTLYAGSGFDEHIVATTTEEMRNIYETNHQRP